MFNAIAEDLIDSFQSGKKTLINTFVQHEGMAKVLNEFVDAQSAYTKSAVAAGIQSTIAFSAIITDKQFIDDLVSGFKNLTPAPIKSKSKKAV